MPTFYCKKCDYLTSNKYDFNKHLNTEKHISSAPFHKNVKKNVSNRDKNVSTKSKVKKDKCYICNGCSKEFPHRSSLSRHKNKFCTQTNVGILEKELVLEKRKNIELTNELIKERDQRIQDLETMIVKQNDNSSNQRHNNNNNVNAMISNNNTINGDHNNINNTTNQLVVNNFPVANRDHITLEQYMNILKNPQIMIAALFELSRFNKNKKENANVKLQSKKMKEILVYEDGFWVDYGLKKIIQDSIDSELENVEDIVDKCKDNGLYKELLDAYQQKIYEKYIEDYHNEWNLQNKDDPSKKKITNDVSKQLYNIAKKHQNNKELYD